MLLVYSYYYASSYGCILQVQSGFEFIHTFVHMYTMCVCVCVCVCVYDMLCVLYTAAAVRGRVHAPALGDSPRSVCVCVYAIYAAAVWSRVHAPALGDTPRSQDLESSPR